MKIDVGLFLKTCLLVRVMGDSVKVKTERDVEVFGRRPCSV